MKISSRLVDLARKLAIRVVEVRIK